MAASMAYLNFNVVVPTDASSYATPATIEPALFNPKMMVPTDTENTNGADSVNVAYDSELPPSV